MLAEIGDLKFEATYFEAEINQSKFGSVEITCPKFGASEFDAEINALKFEGVEASTPQANEA